MFEVVSVGTLLDPGTQISAKSTHFYSCSRTRFAPVWSALSKTIEANKEKPKSGSAATACTF